MGVVFAYVCIYDGIWLWVCNCHGVLGGRYGDVKVICWPRGGGYNDLDDGIDVIGELSDDDVSVNVTNSDQSFLIMWDKVLAEIGRIRAESLDRSFTDCFDI